MYAKFVIPAALALATAMEGQIPITPMQCGGVRVLDSAESHELQPRAFGIQDRGFCSQYTLGGGLETPLNLYLGEDSEDHSTWIAQAASEWSLAMGFNPGINVVRGRRPATFSVPDSAWRDGSRIPARNAQDGQSVIYIKNERGDDLAHGFAHVRMSRGRGDRIEEADIYIKAPGITGTKRMAVTHGTGYVDREHSVYSVVDDLYAVILHELGHAVGLEHIGGAGNLMSLLPSTSGPWSRFSMQLYAMGRMQATVDPLTVPYVFRIDSMRSRMPVDTKKMHEAWVAFSFGLEPGPQDRTALMCIYEAD